MHPHDIWADRTVFISKLIDSNMSVVDFGCGSSLIRDILNIKNYIGIDLNNSDINIDLNKTFPNLDHYNIGLAIGVLEYLENPEQFLINASRVTDNMIVCCLISSKPKKTWKTHFRKENLVEILNRTFTRVVEHRYGPKYYVFECKCKE